jgi:hypothetical protein
LFLIGVALAWRGAQAGSVLATDDRIRVRTLARTYRLAAEAVAKVSCEELSVGLLGYKRRVLVILMNDGRRITANDFNRASRGRRAGTVPATADQLNDFTRQRADVGRRRLVRRRAGRLQGRSPSQPPIGDPDKAAQPVEVSAPRGP